MPERSKESLEAELKRLRSENCRRQKENQALRQEPGLVARDVTPAEFEASETTGVTNHASVDKKIRLFRSLFRGREDVYPVRWENQKGRAGYSPACGKPKGKCGACPNNQFLPVTDRVIHDHLTGKETIGVYPILEDGSCWFLAIDFDETSYGAHVWIFFSQPVQTSLSRMLGSLDLTHAMARRPGICLESYDRLFPSQDTLPTGGFSNLIAFPRARLKRAIQKHGMPPSLQNTLIRFAAFQSLDFYRAQATRMSTYGKPRIISCADDLDQEIVLPRGCLDAAISALEDQGVATSSARR